MKVSFSPNIIPSGCLSSKHQITNYVLHSCQSPISTTRSSSVLAGRIARALVFLLLPQYHLTFTPSPSQLPKSYFHNPSFNSLERTHCTCLRSCLSVTIVSSTTVQSYSHSKVFSPSLSAIQVIRLGFGRDFLVCGKSD